MSHSQPLRVGIGGPVGSGKTALTLALCRALRDKYNLAVVTNARGGSSLRIGDDGDVQMNMKTVVIDGIECQMTDTAAAFVQRTIKGLQDQVENFKKKAKEKEEEKGPAMQKEASDLG